MSNARNSRESFEHVFNMKNHAKNVDFQNIFNQLIFVYKNFDAKLKQFIKVSTSKIIIKQFMNQLKKRKII